MSVAALRGLVMEARRVDATMSAQADGGYVGPVAVSGMLAEQLVKELGGGAEPGTVVVGGLELVGRADVLVRIVAGDPTEEDEQLVGAADAGGVPVVMVQLWPQADWAAPFVLTPFVVECRTGEGFPVSEISERIVEASENGAVLASRVPVIADVARSSAVRTSVLRSGLIALAGSRLGVSRQLLTLEQVRLLSQLRAGATTAPATDDLRARAGGAAAVLAAGYAFRGVARSLRRVLPAPVANVTVATAGTWALAKAFELAESRLSEQ